ncbi:MAG TPA: tetratricopeptide repeat protein, partial [Terriglobales bacterium]|nr:tetratricopeptide repeat protein [Terriglobales bacterium]
MTRLTRPAAILVLVAAATLPVLADKAKTLYKQGQDAEARQNYEQAFEDYKQAFDLKPKDLLYRQGFERMRFLAGASHVHRGQLLREAGKMEEALAEFQKAAEIDPSSSIARQEIKRTQRMMDEASSPVPRASAPKSNSLSKRVENAAGPVDLTPISNVPITIKATQDTKGLYETVGKLAGINVLFDPDYTSRRIAIELNGVSLEDALEIISLESKTFWRTVTPNTI